MQLGANGSVLVAYGLWDDGDDYYLLLRPDGAIAIDDTLASDGDGRALTMSPCGRYYYRYRQGVDEIVLQLVAGGELKLPLPKSPSDLQPLDELPTLVRFLSPELLFAATRFTNAPPRRIVWDLTVDPRRMIEPEALQDVPPEQHLSGPLAGDLTPTGDLILFEEWEGEYALRYEACCYDSRGALKWHQSPNLRWPGWIFAAKDHPIIAVASNTWLTTLDVSTGLTLDTKRLWEESSHAWPHPHEGAFDDGLLTLGGRGGGDGNTPILISVQVGEDGEISPPIVTRDWIWGFGKDRPICGAAVPDSAGGWLIAGFRRQ